MSSKKIDKSKWYHKLHQLQKRLDRADVNNGHADHKKDKRKGQLKRLLERVRGDKKMFSL